VLVEHGSVAQVMQVKSYAGERVRRQSGLVRTS
jgi:hypothetical protein